MENFSLEENTGRIIRAPFSLAIITQRYNVPMKLIGQVLRAQEH